MSFDENTVLAETVPACILVVEDEFLIRLMISELMRDAGYRVIEASDADEGVDIIRSGVHLDLVFSDIRMPGSMDGLGFLLWVKSTKPDLPVIITSAHGDPVTATKCGAAHFVRKPYNIDVVVNLINEELKSFGAQ